MQIVIDIPDKIYKELTETAIIVTEVYPSTIERALTEGIVLPKGHGALKDADKLAVEIAMIRDKYNYYGDECEPELFQAYDNCVDKIIDAATIIEADEEGAEE